MLNYISHSGNANENPYMIFYDYTKRYAFYQTVAQEKNESVLSFRQETLKNQQLKQKKRVE